MAARRLTSLPTSQLHQSNGFAALGVPAPLVAVLAERGVTTPFPIQTATLPDSLAGRDVLGRGQTGSGKTYAFALPVLARLAASNRTRRPNRPRALILAPTRELAAQLEAALTPLAAALSLRILSVYGGVSSSRQIAGLRAGVDVLVACPGRLADHIRGGRARLDAVEATVLDEADQMADLGFLPQVRALLQQTPEDGQRLLFSATLDRGVDGLVREFLTNPVTHSIDAPIASSEAVTHHVLRVSSEDRLQILIELTGAPSRTLVFTRTRHGARALARKLVQAGVPAVELHGDLAQAARSRNLAAFATGTASTLVATDIAARGIHVDEVALVIHADPPAEHKAYLHRSGRTARAGATGTVVTLMTEGQVKDVHLLTRRAGVATTTTRLGPGHALITELAPGPRTFVPPPAQEKAPTPRGKGGQGSRTSAAQGSRTGAAQGSRRTSVTADPAARPSRTRARSPHPVQHRRRRAAV